MFYKTLLKRQDTDVAGVFDLGAGGRSLREWVACVAPAEIRLLLGAEVVSALCEQLGKVVTNSIHKLTIVRHILVL